MRPSPGNGGGASSAPVTTPIWPNGKDYDDILATDAPYETRSSTSCGGSCSSDNANGRISHDYRPLAQERDRSQSVSVSWRALAEWCRSSELIAPGGPTSKRKDFVHKDMVHHRGFTDLNTSF